MDNTLDSYTRGAIIPVIDVVDSLGYAQRANIMNNIMKLARDDFYKLQDQLDAFYDKYGDYYNPSPEVTKMYHDATDRKITNIVNKIYANGGDPYRNPQDMAEIRRQMRAIDRNAVSLFKQDAAMRNAYVAAMGAAKQNGTYYDDFNTAVDGDVTKAQLDENGNLIPWTLAAPTKYETLEQMMSNLSKQIESGVITPAEAQRLVAGKVPGAEVISSLFDMNNDGKLSKGELTNNWYEATGRDLNAVRGVFGQAWDNMPDKVKAYWIQKGGLLNGTDVSKLSDEQKADLARTSFVNSASRYLAEKRDMNNVVATKAKMAQDSQQFWAKYNQDERHFREAQKTRENEPLPDITAELKASTKAAQKGTTLDAKTDRNSVSGVLDYISRHHKNKKLVYLGSDKKYHTTYWSKVADEFNKSKYGKGNAVLKKYGLWNDKTEWFSNVYLKYAKLLQGSKYTAEKYMEDYYNPNLNSGTYRTSAEHNLQETIDIDDVIKIGTKPVYRVNNPNNYQMWDEFINDTFRRDGFKAKDTKNYKKFMETIYKNDDISVYGSRYSLGIYHAGINPVTKRDVVATKTKQYISKDDFKKTGFKDPKALGLTDVGDYYSFDVVHVDPTLNAFGAADKDVRESYDNGNRFGFQANVAGSIGGIEHQ